MPFGRREVLLRKGCESERLHLQFQILEEEPCPLKEEKRERREREQRLRGMCGERREERRKEKRREKKRRKGQARGSTRRDNQVNKGHPSPSSSSSSSFFFFFFFFFFFRECMDWTISSGKKGGLGKTEGKKHHGMSRAEPLGWQRKRKETPKNLSTELFLDITFFFLLSFFFSTAISLSLSLPPPDFRFIRATADSYSRQSCS